MNQQLKDSLFTTVLGIIGLFVHFAQQSLLARIIPPVQYAAFVSLGYLLFLSVFFNCLIPLLVIKKLSFHQASIEEQKNQYINYSKIVHYISFVCFIFLLFILKPVQQFVKVTSWFSILIVFIYLVSIIYFAFYTAVLQSLKKFKLIAVIQLVQNIVRFILILSTGYLLLNNGFIEEHQIALLGLLFSVLFANMYMINKIHNYFNIDLDSFVKNLNPFKKTIFTKQDIIYAIATSMMYSFITFLNSFDIPVSRWLFTESISISFGPITSLSKLCFSVPAMITGVYFPFFVSHFQSQTSALKDLLHSIVLVVFLGCGITFVLAFDSQLTTTLIFGKAYLGAENTLIISCLAMTVLAVINLLVHFSMAYSKYWIVGILAFILLFQILGVVVIKPDSVEKLVLFEFIVLSISLIIIVGFCIFFYSRRYKKGIA